MVPERVFIPWAEGRNVHFTKCAKFPVLNEPPLKMMWLEELAWETYNTTCN